MATEAPSVSPYRAAIDRTAEVIVRRARNFRNLVVVVAIVGVASVAWALVARAPSALAGLLLLVPICGCFLLVDARLLNEWRSEILAGWIRRDLDLAAFRHALVGHPTLPAGTMEAMLAGFPSAGNLVAEQRIAVPNRRAAAALSDALHRERADGLLQATAAVGVLVIVAVLAVWGRTWTPLPGLAILALLPVLRAWVGRRRRARRDQETAACRRAPEFSEADHARLLDGLR